MEKQVFKCQQCGSEFTAERNDAKYCSDSCRTLASKQRKESVLKIEYTADELKQLNDSAKNAGLTTETLVKQKSLLTGLNIMGDKKKINEQEDEITKLKAHLSIFTNDIDPVNGIFINPSKDEAEEIREIISEYYPDWPFNEALIDVITSLPFSRGNAYFNLSYHDEDFDESFEEFKVIPYEK